MTCMNSRNVAVLLLTILCCAAFSETPLGSSFSYQGRLLVSGTPATGAYDLHFKLYDSPTTTTQIGSTLSLPGVSVTNGLFTVTVDFGAGAFAGNKRWLETSVYSGGEWIVLAPRTEIMPAPQASYSLSATTATMATTSQKLAWQTVTAHTSAQPNGRYLVDSTSTVNITLPASPVVGDIVAVTSANTGGWKLVQNSGQTIRTRTLGIPPERSNWAHAGEAQSWITIASSADGSRLAACAFLGSLFTSADYGMTWTERTAAGFGQWQQIASSADGQTLAAVSNGRPIYISQDAGATWTPRESSRAWSAIASSADGKKLVAGYDTKILVSTDSGTSWTERFDSHSYYFWDIAMSADGTKVAAGDIYWRIFRSADSGLTWNPCSDYLGWRGMACSADGVKLVAVAAYDHLFTSSDSGTTWTARDTVRDWRDVASSADGVRLVACVYPGQIYISIDSGATWKAVEGNRAWSAVASSADGMHLAATENAGPIFTCPAPQTTTGVGGWLSCAGSGAIEVQYVGSGAWVPLTHEGELSAN